MDGAADLDALVERAGRYGMSALAVTDHQGLYGAVRFYRKALEAGLRPIVGAEVTIVELMDQIVPQADSQIAKMLQRALKKRKMAFKLKHKVTAVDVHHRPGDVRGPVRGEEDDDVGHLLGASRTASRAA